MMCAGFTLGLLKNFGMNQGYPLDEETLSDMHSLSAGSTEILRGMHSPLRIDRQKLGINNGLFIDYISRWSDEYQWWGKEPDGFKKRKQTEQVWKVSLEDIVARNYNLDIKNPHVSEVINHDPEVWLK